MPRSRIIILSAAAVIALLVMFLLRPAPSQQAVPGVVVTPEIEEIVPERILVAARDLPLGDYMERKDMAWVEIPPDSVPQNAITEKLRPRAIREFKGWVLNNSVSKGDPIFESLLINSGGAGFIATRLAAGMRAASVKISPDHAAGGFIVPNDRVDVVLVQRPKRNPTPENTFPRALLENVRVIAINQVYARDKKTSKAGTPIHHIRGETATLELTPRDVEVLLVASELGLIHLTLRGLKDIASPQGATSFGLSLLPDISRVPLYTREGKSNDVLRAGEFR